MENKTQPIQTEDIKKLAQLARLGVAPEELDLFARDMTRLVEWVSILQAAPTDNLEPLTHPHEAPTRLRGDIVTEAPFCQENDENPLLSNATQHQDGFFLVPQVIS